MKIKQYIALFLFMIMVTPQLVSLHEHAHDHEDTACELCLYSHEFSQLDWQPATTVKLPKLVKLFVPVKIQIDYAFAKAQSTTTSFSTRPPPFTC